MTKKLLDELPSKADDARGQPARHSGPLPDAGEREAALERLQRAFLASPAVVYLLKLDDRPAAGLKMAKLIKNDHVVGEYRFRQENGDYRWLRDEARLLRDVAGRPLECAGSWCDITECKRLEEQFRHAQKLDALGRLAGGVAHDFNNLLTVISGYTEFMLSTLREGDPLRDHAKQIHKAGERAESLTRQLLAFSRKQIVNPTALDLNALLVEMEKMLGRLIGEDIAVAVQLDPRLWKVRADVGQLEQVIMNLAINARDAMPDGGRLTIETANVDLDETYARRFPGRSASGAQPGQYVMLAVSDNGFGMDAATQARIFEPFFTTKGPGKGTGLGLATVLGIVKQSGGHLEVGSELGVGSTFKIYLPRHEDATVTSKAHAWPTVTPSGTETVLLVEDDDEVRFLARLVLERSGYRVLETSNPEQALLVCEDFEAAIHLLVTDVVMPGMNGRRLAEHVLLLRPQTKVLYLSGHSDDAIVHHCLLDQDTPFLQKPFATFALAVKVREVLDQ